VLSAINHYFQACLDAEPGTRKAIQTRLQTVIAERLDPKIELTVYRCITELVNNTMKHAAANRITLDMGRTEGELAFRFIGKTAGTEDLTTRELKIITLICEGLIARAIRNQYCTIRCQSLTEGDRNRKLRVFP